MRTRCCSASCPKTWAVITSRVSGRGHRIGAVCVCLSVHLSVCLCALSQVNRLTYGQEILHGDLPGPYPGQV